MGEGWGGRRRREEAGWGDGGNGGMGEKGTHPVAGFMLCFICAVQPEHAKLIFV